MIQLTQISVCLIAGLMMTRLFKMMKLNFPDVTAYLITGLLLGPYVLGRIGIQGLGFQTVEQVSSMDVISTVALGFIAFTIGNEFKLEELKEIGKKAVIIGIAEGTAACIVVDAAMIALHFVLGDAILSLPAAITLGAIASATAPAATLMVVRQYKAKGPVTDLLLPIVALDDAVCLILFAVSFGVAQAMLSSELDVISVFVEPLVQIIASVVLGAIMGVILTKLETLFYSNSNRLAMAIGFVILTISLASTSFSIGPVTIKFSSLLVCMMLGTVLCNLSPRADDIMLRSDKWTVPLYELFFVLSGAELQLNVFRNPLIVLVGLTYVVTRCVGKYIGASSFSAILGCAPTVRKYLGITLFPQAGVALGMSLQAVKLGEESGVLVRNIVLFGVLIYELIGPQLTRISLTSAGEIVAKSQAKTTHERFEKKKENA